MIDVGMAQENNVDGGGVEREMAISIHGFLAAALEEAALEETGAAIDFQEVHGTGGGAGGAVEADLHMA